MSKTFLDENGFLHPKRPKTINFKMPPEREIIEPDYFNDLELYKAKGGVLLYDIEFYPNYFLVAFKCFYTNKVVAFDIFPGREVFNKEKLLWVVHNFCIVGFNSLKFDIILLWLVLKGATLEQIEEAVQDIIVYGARARDIENKFMFRMGQVNHIDLIEVAPLSASLKLYMGRLHAKRLQELPYDPHTYLTEEQAHKVKLYCFNDLDGTGLLLKELSPQLDLRVNLSQQYGIDLRSKSDAQIAETVICSEVAKLKGYWPKKAKFESGLTFHYPVPDFIQYKTSQLQRMRENVANAVFVLSDAGKVIIPKSIQDLNINIGSSVYNLTIGGLHSTEESISHYADENTYLLDVDVASYYPAIVLNLGLYPESIGEEFIIVYRSIVERRLAAKKAKDKKTANSLKITINGGFGKLGNKYSNFYSPNLMISVTMTGQLSLLMLIEAIELVGIPVVSGNTDGIVIKCPKNRKDDLEYVIKLWEEKTNFETEETQYKSIHSRDVNNYLAIKENGEVDARFLDEQLGVKVKGTYAERGSALNSVLSKNPENLICSDAIMNLLTKGIPVEKTITECKDLRRFITVRTVKGGAEQNGVFLGKIVRFYHALKQPHCINYISTGNKVPNSDGAKQCMDLPSTFPSDIDYDYYISKTVDILFDIGYYQKVKQSTFF